MFFGAGDGSPATGVRLAPIHAEVLLLEFLPWRDLRGSLCSCCKRLKALAEDPCLWTRKHREHFQWASERYPVSAGPNLSWSDFRELLRSQKLALNGDRLDFIGTWLGKDMFQSGYVYHCRLTVLAGVQGQVLWRGKEDDAPFYRDDDTVIDGQLDSLAEQPVELRTSNRHNVEEIRRLRRVECVGDEKPVGGHIQWFVGEETEPSQLLQIEAIARNIVPGMSTVLRRRALECVCGSFSPSTRRLLLAGTHINHAGFGVIGLDQYDLTLSEDGLSVQGVTRGHHTPAPGRYLNELRADAQMLPRARIEGIEFVSHAEF
eukprot:TRINITY_DN9946_c0_g2_i2.p1 TRINITY_DN9946_c0_g2~~TRINITY_DN9946_c0_g2_i2.p1  ORF type:complete len:318 (+),score=44.06 TRINITY_DN9946_c0_g2_i2:41-994(+)